MDLDDLGILVARLIIGLGLAAHGSQKLFGWFGGYGIKGTGSWLESIGFRPGPAFALLAGLAELAGGLLMALGLFGPVGPAIVIAVMVVAIATVHWPHGFFAQANGYELPLAYAAGALAVAFAGPGAYSLDAILGIPPADERTTWLLVAVAIVVGLISLAARRQAPAPRPA